MSSSSSLQELEIFTPKSLGSDPSEIVTVEKVISGLRALGVPGSFDASLRELLAGKSQEALGILWGKLDSCWGDPHTGREAIFAEMVDRFKKKYGG